MLGSRYSLVDRTSAKLPTDLVTGSRNPQQGRRPHNPYTLVLKQKILLKMILQIKILKHLRKITAKIANKFSNKEKKVTLRLKEIIKQSENDFKACIS